MPAPPDRKVLQLPETAIAQAFIEGESLWIERVEPRPMAAPCPRLVLRERDQTGGDPLPRQALRHEDEFDREPAPPGASPQAADHVAVSGRPDHNREILDPVFGAQYGLVEIAQPVENNLADGGRRARGEFDCVAHADASRRTVS